MPHTRFLASNLVKARSKIEFYYACQTKKNFRATIYKSLTSKCETVISLSVDNMYLFYYH